MFVLNRINIQPLPPLVNSAFVLMGNGNLRQWEKFHGINYKLIRSFFLQEVVSFNWGENNDHNSSNF